MKILALEKLLKSLSPTSSSIIWTASTSARMLLNAARSMLLRGECLLNRSMAGLLLRHDTFGNHFDSRNRTVDLMLEKQNLLEAGRVLSATESRLTSVVVDPNKSEPEHDIIERDEEWKSRHIRSSQYLVLAANM